MGRGEFIAVVVGTPILVGASALALSNLINRVALLPSAVWIALMLFVLTVNIREAGFRPFCTSLLAAFSRRQLLRVCSGPDGSTLEVGFKFLGSKVVQRRIQAGDLVALEWKTGQASEMAERDVGDWSVIVWYRHGDSTREIAERERGLRRPGEVPLIIGPARPRQITESLAHRTLAFLHDSGIAVPHEQPSAPGAV